MQKHAIDLLVGFIDRSHAPRFFLAFASHAHGGFGKRAPGAEQGLSYGLAALRHKGKPLLGFKAAKDHLAVFPFSPAAVDVVRERLAGYSLSKGTIRFTTDMPLPDDVVRDLVRQRLGEIG